MHKEAHHDINQVTYSERERGWGGDRETCIVTQTPPTTTERLMERNGAQPRQKNREWERERWGLFITVLNKQ